VDLAPKITQVRSNVVPGGLDHFDSARVRLGLVYAKPVPQTGQIHAAREQLPADNQQNHQPPQAAQFVPRAAIGFRLLGVNRLAYIAGHVGCTGFRQVIRGIQSPPPQ